MFNFVQDDLKYTEKDLLEFKTKVKEQVKSINDELVLFVQNLSPTTPSAQEFHRNVLVKIQEITVAKKVLQERLENLNAAVDNYIKNPNEQNKKEISAKRDNFETQIKNFNQKKEEAEFLLMNLDAILLNQSHYEALGKDAREKYLNLKIEEEMQNKVKNFLNENKEFLEDANQNMMAKKMEYPEISDFTFNKEKSHLSRLEKELDESLKSLSMAVENGNQDIDDNSGFFDIQTIADARDIINAKISKIKEQQAKISSVIESSVINAKNGAKKAVEQSEEVAKKTPENLEESIKNNPLNVLTRNREDELIRSELKKEMDKLARLKTALDNKTNPAILSILSRRVAIEDDDNNDELGSAKKIGEEEKPEKELERAVQSLKAQISEQQKKIEEIEKRIREKANKNVEVKPEAAKVVAGPEKIELKSQDEEFIASTLQKIILEKTDKIRLVEINQEQSVIYIIFDSLENSAQDVEAVDATLQDTLKESGITLEKKIGEDEETKKSFSYLAVTYSDSNTLLSKLTEINSILEKKAIAAEEAAKVAEAKAVEQARVTKLEKIKLKQIKQAEADERSKEAEAAKAKEARRARKAELAKQQEALQEKQNDPNLASQDNPNPLLFSEPANAAVGDSKSSSVSTKAKIEDKAWENIKTEVKKQAVDDNVSTSEENKVTITTAKDQGKIEIVRKETEVTVSSSQNAPIETLVKNYKITAKALGKTECGIDASPSALHTAQLILALQNEPDKIEPVINKPSVEKALREAAAEQNADPKLKEALEKYDALKEKRTAARKPQAG